MASHGITQEELTQWREEASANRFGVIQAPLEACCLNIGCHHELMADRINRLLDALQEANERLEKERSLK